MAERTNLASLVAAGVTLLTAAAIGMWKRPAHTVAAGLFVGIVVWLIDWITEVRAEHQDAESRTTEDAEAASA